MTMTVTVAPEMMSTSCASPPAAASFLMSRLGIGFRQRANARLGNADEHDRLGMLDEAHAGNDRIVVERDDNVDRLSGIARRGDVVGGQERPADNLLATHQRHRREFRFRRAIAIRRGVELRGGDLGQIAHELRRVAGGCERRLCKNGEEGEKWNKRLHEPHAPSIWNIGASAFSQTAGRASLTLIKPWRDLVRAAGLFGGFDTR